MPQIDTYLLFLAAVAVLRLLASPAEREALSVLLVATLAGQVLGTLVSPHLVGEWKLAHAAAIEAATAAALLRLAPGPAGRRQLVCVSVAWLLHVLCLVDYVLGTDLVYDRYATALGLVCLAQLAACHDTLRLLLLRLVQWLAAGAQDRAPAARAAGAAHSLVSGLRIPRP